MLDLMPAPDSTNTSCFAATSFLTVSGVAATRVSPSRLSTGMPSFMQSSCCYRFLKDVSNGASGMPDMALQTECRLKRVTNPGSQTQAIAVQGGRCRTKCGPGTGQPGVIDGEVHIGAFAECIIQGRRHRDACAAGACVFQLVEIHGIPQAPWTVDIPFETRRIGIVLVVGDIQFVIDIRQIPLDRSHSVSTTQTPRCLFAVGADGRAEISGRIVQCLIGTA